MKSYLTVTTTAVQHKYMVLDNNFFRSQCGLRILGFGWFLHRWPNQHLTNEAFRGPSHEMFEGGWEGDHLLGATTVSRSQSVIRSKVVQALCNLVLSICKGSLLFFFKKTKPQQTQYIMLNFSSPCERRRSEIMFEIIEGLGSSRL